MKKQTLTCTTDPRYTVELDYTEAHPDDPGAGTPAMVYGPNGTSGTFFCVRDTGWLNEGERNGHEVPPGVERWLEEKEELVDEYVNVAFAYASNPHRDAASPVGAEASPVIQEFTVASEGSSLDEVEITGASIDDDQFQFLLDTHRTVYARDQNGVVMEVSFDMDGESLVAVPMKETATGLEQMSDDDWREHVPTMSP
ncbi:hypothetical protein N7359_01685 [Stenotrophomonas maltophilia]|uniref:hypothetical protein n=1 Tax=Stenotrophomonas maltophilia TaxID=40324 RepID=UPI0024484F16|nr:hypothetical protein [Stenotrophomonas maltophilia]MDH0071253.1 hypothetical protein [Stenotrophomonas maltophilia]MDH0104150.1 hypothetical protein [Stenotrophomonas maltophilia]MDH0330200.1 hypothetical protein [Stenotrophomonas maltophilia]